MDIFEVYSQIERVKRLLKHKRDKEIAPMKYMLTGEITPSGHPEVKIVESIDPQDIEDLARNLIINTYHIKDRLLSNPKVKGSIENEINNDVKLSICADLANWAKHGELRISRSGRYPYIQGGRTYHSDFVKDEKSSSWVATHGEVFANVCNKDGKYIGDAFEIALYALEKFENISIEKRDTDHDFHP